MSEEKNNESKAVDIYRGNLPQSSECNKYSEKIRVFTNRNEEKRTISNLLRIWSFAAAMVAFAAIFACIYSCVLLFNKDSVNFSQETADIESESSYKDCYNIPENENTDKKPPEILNESKLSININDYFDNDFSFGNLLGGGNEVKVIIIHSHTSELVSENMSVIEAGDAMVQILRSADIEAYHCLIEHDKDGRLGAYKRMRESLFLLKEEYKGAVLVIDLHNSDTNFPITFTVGTSDDYGWKENLRVCTAIHNKIEAHEAAIRFLPDGLGQDNGILTVNIGIGSNESSDNETRNIIASAITAIIALFNETTPT